MKKLLFLVPFSASLGAVCTAWAQDMVPPPQTVAAAPFDWQIRLRAGQKFRTSLDMTMKMTQNIPASPKAMRMETASQNHFVVDQNVLFSNERGAKVEIIYRELTQQVRVSQDGKLQFDSLHPPKGQNVIPDIGKSIVGARISYSLSPQGKISNVQGFKEYFNRIWASASKGQTAAQQKATRAAFEQFMSPAALQNMLEKSIGTLPAQPVSPGESWKYNIDMRGVMSSLPSISGTRTFVSRQNGVVTIEEKSNFSSDPAQAFPVPGAPKTKVAAPAMRIALSGTVLGQSLIDEQTGMAQQSQSTERMSGKIFLNNVDGKGKMLTSSLFALVGTKSTTKDLSPLP